MKRWLTLLICAATVAVVLPRTSVADSATMGVALQWGNCFGGPSASSSKNFACNVNTGANVMYCSFVPPGDMVDLIAATGVIDVHSDQAALPPWWDITPVTGGTNCRAGTTVSANFNFASGPFDCADIWGGQAAGGVSSNYVQVNGDPTRVRINWVCATVPGGPVPDSTLQYYACTIAVNNAKTTGAGNCAGCNFGACIRLNRVQLTMSTGDIAIDGLSPTLPGSTQQIYWNTDSAAPSCTFTPTRNQSWGQIKSLYR
jgi:hypothetical protein